MSERMPAVATLATDFSGRLLVDGDSAWDQARRVHNGLIDKRPALVAQCRGSADIALAVRFARDHGLEIAVRGGGHNVSGRSTVDGGIVIDLALMQYVHVDPLTRTARVAGGTLWGHLNRETQVHGLATTGGVVSTTGVAGLTLGGGLGWLMPRHGMALDNLESVELVLADGRVVRAGPDEHDDLFWAVRGGGGNFGVASSFEFKLHPVGPMVAGGLVAWPFERAGDVLRHFRSLAARADDDTMLIAAMITAPDRSTRLAAMGVGCFGPAGHADRWFAAIRALGPPVLDALGPIPYAHLNAMLDASYPAGARNYWKSHFLEHLGDDAIAALVASFARCTSPMSHVILEHFHGAAARIAPTATAYALRGDGFNALFLSQWQDADGDASGIAWARESSQTLAPFVGERRYVNYLGEDDAGEAALAAAYGPNLARLQAIKAAYDPQNVFHLNLNIPPRAP